MSLTSLERTIKTINLEIPDRVPVDLHNFAMAANSMDEPMNEVFQDGKLMAYSQIKLWERYKHDMILMENGVTAMAEAMGAEVEYYPDSVPEIKEPYLKRLKDVKDLSVPDVYTAGTLPELIRATEILVDEIGDEVFIMGRADQGPFSLAALIRGMENFMMDLLDPAKKDLIKELLNICTEAITNLALAQIEAGANGTSIGESLAGPDVTSPEIYKEFAFPYEKRIIRAVKDNGGIISLHICGDCTPIIEEMVQTGAQILEIDEKTNLAAAKSVVKDKCCLLGPVSPTIIRNGNPEEIKQLTYEAIDIAGDGGGLILGPGCALAQDTPPANIEALVSAAREHNIYK